MSSGRHNIVVYIGSGKMGQARRVSIEKQARAHGYVKNGKVRLSPFIVAILEGKSVVRKSK